MAQTLFDAGATTARVQGAQAAYDGRIASYRQTVLTAFQSVEGQLIVLDTLAAQAPLRHEALSAAQRIAQQLLRRYREGQVSHTDVVTAQLAAPSAEGALLQLQVDRRLAAAALVQALGAGRRQAGRVMAKKRYRMRSGTGSQWVWSRLPGPAGSWGLLWGTR